MSVNLAKVDNITEEFERIMRINSALKQISILSYKVKMRALNTLIIARKSSDGVSGFAVISMELITFSIQLQGVTDYLDSLIHKIFSKSTQKAKIIRRIRIIDRTIRIQEQMEKKSERDMLLLGRIKERETLENTENNRDIESLLKELYLKIKEAIRLCNRGRTISVFGKIESAYARDDKEIYLLLSENVEDYLDEAEKTLKRIQQTWS